jgi:hypothetical protein
MREEAGSIEESIIDMTIWLTYILEKMMADMLYHFGLSIKYCL